MQELERTINICHTAFIVFLILAIVFLVVSLIFFFWFNIRGIYDMLTGRGERRTIQKMQELNDQTGKLREDILTNTPVSLSPENRIVAPPVKEKCAGQTERVHRAREAGDSNAEGSQETTLLGGEGMQETTVLTGEGSQETTLLTGDGLEENRASAAVKENSGYAAGRGQSEESQTSYGEPAVLLTGQIQDNPYPARKIDLPGAFKIEKEIIWVHTEVML